MSKAPYILECVLIIESDLNLFLANLALTTVSLTTSSHVRVLKFTGEKVS